MACRISLTIVAGLILGAPLPRCAAQDAQNASAACPAGTLYALNNASTYQQGCFPPCLCPMMETRSLQGTFRLREMAFDGLYWIYAVSDVEWKTTTGEPAVVLKGAGTYRWSIHDVTRQRLELDLAGSDGTTQHFDSGLVIGGWDFPRINIAVSINNQFCHDTVLAIDAAPVGSVVPRHAAFTLNPSLSNVSLTLFVGSTHSKVAGVIQLFLGDPSVPVPLVVGAVGLSVDRADLVAVDFEPDLLPDPLAMRLDPRVKSIGSWNTRTGQVAFSLHLIASNGGLPVPQPLYLSGNLLDGRLSVTGDNGNVADGLMVLTLVGCECPPPMPEIWFSTTRPFTAAKWISNTANTTPMNVSAGDLLSSHGYVVRRNAQLMARLGVMPPTPDVGLDAVSAGPRAQTWFSFAANAPIWSETLKTWLRHGDLLSDAGAVVRTNEKLLERFVRMPVVSDAGLDAVARSPNGEILFSTAQAFFSEALGQQVGRGDLLSDRGRIVMTNRDLLKNFHPVTITAGILPPDFGLDAIVIRSNKEIWFSTETGFQDALLGPISDGDLLSNSGRIVRENLDLLTRFAPIEDLANFGLDAATVVYPARTGDFDFDGDADQLDVDSFLGAASGPARPSHAPELGDFDGDGDVDQDDFGVLQRCMGEAEPQVGSTECPD